MTSVAMAVFGLIASIIAGTVISLIIAAFLKRAARQAPPPPVPA